MGQRQDERKVQAPKGDPPLMDIQRSASARPAREIAALPEEMPENAKRGFVAHQPPPFES
jgi:hypothetical protein